MERPNIISVVGKSDKTLELGYSNGEIREFDVKPYIEGSWFGELNDDAYFQSVRIINNGRGIEWSNGQDIAPHELYEQSKLINKGGLA